MVNPGKRTTAHQEIAQGLPLVRYRRIRRAPRQHNAHTAPASDQTESERKTLEAEFKFIPQGFTATDECTDCLAKAGIFESHVRLLAPTGFPNLGKAPKSPSARHKTN